jgi:hypothetical protein
VLNELRGGLWYPALLKITTGSDAYQWRDRHAPDNGVGFIDRPHAYRHVNPIFHHIAHEVRQNQIHLKAGIEGQQMGNKRQNMKTAESSRCGDPD